MPFGLRPNCSACKTTTSPMWRKDELGVVMCNSCYINHLNSNTRDDSISVVSDNDSVNSGSNNGLRTAIVAAKQNELMPAGHKDGSICSNVRKSSRIRPASKSKSQQSKANAGKGKNRRFIFKKTIPIKSHTSYSTIVTSSSVFYKGFYYQVGDIVSLVDHSGDIYYAQIYGLLQDQYCEKSALITWLLPTTLSDTLSDIFDPTTYILGPSEELPRKLEYMEFVCHAPADYYQPKYVPIPGLHKQPIEKGFIWTNIGPKVCQTPTTEEIFGVHPDDLTLVPEVSSTVND